MDYKESVIANGFLQNAAPEVVYAWLRDNHIEYSGKRYVFQSNPKEIQEQLFGRNDKIIDLGLAAWGDDHLVAKAIYRRHCSPSVCASHWPPEKFTYQHSVLTALLSSRCATIILIDPELFQPTDFDEGNARVVLEALVPRLTESRDIDFLRLIYLNPWSGFSLLHQCAKREGLYSRMSDTDWLHLLLCLGGNAGLTRIGETNSEEPDLDHWEIHSLFVHAVSIAPKTDEGASTVFYLLRYMPESATDGAFPKNRSDALEAWNVDVPLKPEGSFNVQAQCRSLATQDGMTPSERVQFHLLRNYWTETIGLDSESRVHRLAAYATKSVTKDFFDNFQKYADRDGAAFVYATSFNKSIWQSREYVQAFLRICPRYFLGKGTITILEDMTAVYEIRESVAPGWAKESEPEISDNEARRLDMSNYEKVVYDSKSSSDNFFLKSAALGVILFCFGLWALYEQSTFMTVVLLALSALCFQESSAAAQIVRIMDRQRLLAMVVNKQTQGIDKILAAIEKEHC